MTSPEARRTSQPLEQVRTMADAGVVARERLEAALYANRTARVPDQTTADALLSIAASLMRLAGTRASEPPAPADTTSSGSHTDRLEVIERQLIAMANSLRTDVFPRIDRLENTLEGGD